MSNFKLYIGNELADFDSSSKIFLNGTLLDISDISKRGLLFTNVLTLPGTNRNERILGFPFRVKKEAPHLFSLLYKNQLIGSGEVDIQSFDKRKGIKVQLLLGGGFWKDAENLMLNDLVLDDYDFLFGDLKKLVFSNRIFNKGNTSQLVTGGSADLFTPRPTYAFKPLIDLIAERLGYSIDYGDTLVKTDISQTGCISNAKDLLVSDYKVRFLDYTIPKGRYINFNDGDKKTNVSRGIIYGKHYDKTRISSNQLEPPKIPLYLIIKGFITSITTTRIEVRKNLNDEVIHSFVVKEGRNFYNEISPEIVTGTSESIQVISGIRVFLNDVTISTAYKESSIFNFRKNESKKNIDYFKDNPPGDLPLPPSGFAQMGYYTDISSFYVLSDYNLPDLTCKDFLKEIIKMNFLSFDINENKKEIKIIPLGKNIDTNNSVDLSNNIEDVKLTYATPKYFASKTLLSYNNDKDVKETGNYVFLSDDIKGETKKFLKVESFSASITYGVNSHLFIYDIKNNTRKELTDRVVYTEGGDVYFEPLSMENIYIKYYKNLVDNISAECSMNIKLDYNLFRKLYDSPLFYVSGLAQYFLMLSIEGFDGEGLCKVKCIKYG